MIRFDNVHKSYGDLKVLKGINAEIGKGNVVCLIGPSGSGKSTLLRCVNGLETYQDGRIEIEGELVSALAPSIHKVRTRVAMVFQRFNLFPHRTALENVMEGQTIVLGRSKAEAKDKAMTQLLRVGLEMKAEEYPARLSGGQKQRVAIARALAMDPEVMLFDEVTSALDPELVGEVLKTMLQLAEDGMTMVCVTHEIGFAYHVANKVCFLHDGLILEQGAPQFVLQTPETQRVRDFLAGHSLFKLPN